MIRISGAVKHLLILNIIFFFATKLFGDNMYAFFSLWFPENPHFYYWQVVTYMFMHGGFMHILFNMYALWAFGSVLEHSWGRNKFLFFYFSAGIGSAVIHTAVNYFRFEGVYMELVNSGISTESILSLIGEGRYNTAWQSVLSNPDDIGILISTYMTPAVGASGAIYGLLVAFAMMFPNTELFLFLIPIPIKAKYFIVGLIIIDFVSGVSGKGLLGSNIAHFAHLGGALFGFIMVWYWRRQESNRKFF